MFCQVKLTDMGTEMAKLSVDQTLESESHAKRVAEEACKNCIWLSWKYLLTIDEREACCSQQIEFGTRHKKHPARSD